jgi:hypothetical protein
MMPATSIEPTVVAAVETAGVMPARVATMMHTIVTMPLMVGTIQTFRQIEARFVSRCFTACTHRLY